MSNACYKIPVENVPKLRRKLERFSRKAVKLGQTPLDIEIVREQLCGDYLYNWVQVVGEAPLINGHTILGKVTFDDGLILPNSAPDRSIPTKYYETTNGVRPSNNCEHCGSRRARKITYILENTEGETIQVGSTCLGDFVDRDVANYILGYFMWVSELVMDDELFDDDDRERDGSTRYVHTMTELRIAQACIAENGWVSKARASENFSVESTYTTMSHSYSVTDVGAEHVRTVEDAVAWLSDQDPDGNEYIYKLQRLVASELCPVHHVSFLISLMGSHKNHLVREAKREQSEKNREPVPAAGRMEISGVVLKIDARNNGFGGVRHVMTIKDDRGFLVWGSIPNTDGVPVDKGTHMTFTAAVQVSDRDEYFGFYKRPTRCSVQTEEK